MIFEKGFDPGTNNTYYEINLGPNSQYLPNVTELTIINNGKPEERSGNMSQKNKADDFIDVVSVRGEILEYVSRMRQCLRDEFKQGYMKMWDGILDLKVIAKQIYKHGKQQGTNFNRNLVCKIIHYLYTKNFYCEEYNASNMARVLEGDDQHSIRTTALCFDPDAETCSALDNFLEDFKL